MTFDPAVVVTGDALIDLTPTTTVRGHLAYEPHPGGSCLNIAVGLGRLGVPTAFLARLSSDAFGQMLRSHLVGSDVQSGYFVDTDDRTTLAAVHLRAGQATYSFCCGGAASPSPPRGREGGGARAGGFHPRGFAATRSRTPIGQPGSERPSGIDH